ncbi:uncharacterized protein ACRADG_006972 [Cochliomyia hominivorax]
MDNCVVCCKSNEDILSRITTISSEWKEWNIQRIIEKHLWWWYLRPPTSKDYVQWMCRQCWLEISTFHSFYIKVEKENRQYNNLFTSIIKSDKEEMTVSLNIKLEDTKVEENCNHNVMLTENVMQIEKRKRGRKKKILDQTNDLSLERIKRRCKEKTSTENNNQIEDLPLIDIKNEIESQDLLQFAPPELDINCVLVTENITPMEWDDSVLYENNDDKDTKDGTVTENDLEKKNNNKNVLDNQKATRKYKKKEIKTEAEKKIKVIKKSSDEIIAEMEFELMCNVCNSKMENFNQLKVHSRQEHNTDGYVKCCNRKYYKRCLLADHLNVHRDPNYFKCLECDKAFSCKFSYVNHMKIHQMRETGGIGFTCDICNKIFLKQCDLKRHAVKHLPEQEKIFQCEFCEKKFASRHLRKQHQSITHSKKYVKFCDICGRVFYNNIPFERHMAEHKGEPSPVIVRCEICDKEIANKYLLQQHIKMMHTKENQQEQICPYCSRVSPNMKCHKYHIRYNHILERKHACHMCDKKFRRPLELREHLSTHTGEALYTCPHCPRTFISNANMHKHRKLVHRKEWEEGRKKKLATALACKNFIKSLTTEKTETSYNDILIDQNEVENNIGANEIVLNF